jgi:hypothetical protein
MKRQPRDQTARIQARRARRSAWDPDYSDRVIDRLQRRRNLPFRQLEEAWTSEVMEPIARLLLRIQRRFTRG